MPDMSTRDLGLVARGMPDTEYDVEFLQGMLDRMAVSFHKYGKVRDAYPHDVSALKSLQQRLDRYLATGNTEFLIDAANFCLIEFMRPSVEGAYYKPTDSDESPGRTAARGHVTDAPNNSRKLW
jgi:hypothetical protein